MCERIRTKERVGLKTTAKGSKTLESRMNHANKRMQLRTKDRKEQKDLSIVEEETRANFPLVHIMMISSYPKKKKDFLDIIVEF